MWCFGGSVNFLDLFVFWVFCAPPATEPPCCVVPVELLCVLGVLWVSPEAEICPFVAEFEIGLCFVLCGGLPQHLDLDLSWFVVGCVVGSSSNWTSLLFGFCSMSTSVFMDVLANTSLEASCWPRLPNIFPVSKQIPKPEKYVHLWRQWLLPCYLLIFT